MWLIEIRSALRGLRARPAFSALVVGVLAIGLGCALFVAIMLNGLMLAPLPFAAPERLFDAGLIDNDDPPDATRFDAVDAATLIEWRERSTGLAQIAALQQRTINLGDGERPERFDGASVSANLFDVLGVQPQIGRGFRADDEVPGAARVLMLSDRLWRQRYLGDPAIVGRELRVNGQQARVIGVMPPRFSYPHSEAAWMPARIDRANRDDRMAVVVRLAAEATPAALRTALDGWFDDALARDPQRWRSEARGVGLQPLAYRFVDRGTRALFWGMAVAVLLVLALAAANATNLILTQMAAREQELWVRGALGASRARLMLHLLAQTALLSGLALLIALPLASVLVDAALLAFARAGSEGPPHWMNFAPDLRLWAIASGITVFTAIGTALLPALALGRSGDGRGGARVQSTRGLVRNSRWLVIAEVALSCTLLISAAVMVQAILRLDRFDLGFDTSRLLTARIALFERGYPDAASQTGYLQRLGDRLRRDPDVEAVTFSSSLPGLIGENVDVLEHGQPRPERGLDNVGYSAVDEHFATTLGLGLVAGRLLLPSDFVPGADRILVDETFARRYAPAGDIVGRRFLLEGGGAAREATIVGVVRAVQMDDIDDPIEPAVLEPMTGGRRFVSVIVRTRGEPLAYADGLLRAVAETDPDTPAYWVRDYDAVLNEAVIGVRMLSRIFAGFGLVALALAAAGLYGVVAFAVAQRTREIGVRRALGAPDARVLQSVAGRSLWQIGIGLGLGLLFGLPFAQLLARPIAHLAGVQLSSWLPVLGVMLLTALLAIWIPARRALRVEPMMALRQE